MSNKPVLMTQVQHAAHRGVSRQCISSLVKRGILVMRGRLVDVHASDAVLDDKPENGHDYSPAAEHVRPGPRGSHATLLRWNRLSFSTACCTIGLWNWRP